MKGLGLVVLLLLSRSGFAEDFQIWSDTQGLIAAPFCEVAPSGPHDPKINALLSSPFRLADGSLWRALEEDQQLLSLNCLEQQKSKNYVLFEVRRHDEVFRVGVNTDEMSIFQQFEPISPEMFLAAQQKVQAAALDLPAGVQVAQGSLEFVVCITGKTLNVRDDSLNKVLFLANRFDVAKPVQSFGTDRQKKTIGGVEYTFIKADFSSKVGWVAENYLRTRQECPGALPPPPPLPPSTMTWTFPTIQRPTDSYKEGMRRFKASRSGGRLHAACDLYRVTGEQAVAVAAGTVIRDRYYFYQGTYALEMKHTEGKVARYGEITGKAAPSIGVNKSVKVGQTVGYIGKVNSNCCKPMLHFELYSGTASGSLTQSGNSFNRRRDLIDPTSLLSTWEKAKFGKSY